MIAEEEFEEMREKEYFCIALGTQLENELFGLRIITRLRYCYNKHNGDYYVIFTVADMGDPAFGGVWWNYEIWTPSYEEFIGLKGWIWYNKSEKPKIKKQRKEGEGMHKEGIVENVPCWKCGDCGEAGVLVEGRIAPDECPRCKSTKIEKPPIKCGGPEELLEKRY